jgi:hypothetical protein
MILSILLTSKYVDFNNINKNLNTEKIQIISENVEKESIS